VVALRSAGPASGILVGDAELTPERVEQHIVPLAAAVGR
jgi:hypothetical protein